jgi:hypothetical protein
MHEGFKYRFVCKNHRDKTEEFFDLLDIPRQARVYWLKRYKRYNPNVFTDKPLSQLCEACKLAEEEAQTPSHRRSVVRRVQDPDEDSHY